MRGDGKNWWQDRLRLGAARSPAWWRARSGRRRHECLQQGDLERAGEILDEILEVAGIIKPRLLALKLFFAQVFGDGPAKTARSALHAQPGLL